MPIDWIDGVPDLRIGDLVRVGRVQCIVRGVEHGAGVCLAYVRLNAQDEPDWIDGSQITLIRRAARLAPDGSLAVPCRPELGEG